MSVVCLVSLVGGVAFYGSRSSEDPGRNQSQVVRSGNLSEYRDIGRGLPSPLAIGAVEEIEWRETQTPVPALPGNIDEPEDVIEEPTLVPTQTPPTPIPTSIPAPDPTATIETRSEAEPRQHLGTDEEDAWAQFREGYRDAGGNPDWEEILVCVVSKEGSFWIGYYGTNGYWTRAQFSDGDTWPKVRRFLISIGIEPNPDSPYIVGLGVGWWANQISHPSHTSGWRGTWALCT